MQIWPSGQASGLEPQDPRGARLDSQARRWGVTGRLGSRGLRYVHFDENVTGRLVTSSLVTSRLAVSTRGLFSICQQVCGMWLSDCRVGSNIS